jgi:hypothetical protein
VTGVTPDRATTVYDKKRDQRWALVKLRAGYNDQARKWLVLGGVTMAKVRVKLGSRAYLFKNANGYAPSVVISAHGYYLPNTGNLAPGFPTLNLYCEDGATLDDVPQATTIRNTRPTEVVPQGNVTTTRNYLLFKYGEHKSTIESRRAKWSKDHPSDQKTFAQMEEMLGGLPGGETYATFLNANDNQNDYVTIRNRHNAFGGPVINLKTLIELIQAEHTYTTIKCGFCREAKQAGFVPDLKADVSG